MIVIRNYTFHIRDSVSSTDAQQSHCKTPLPAAVVLLCPRLVEITSEWLCLWLENPFRKNNSKHAKHIFVIWVI